jgi:hypothetical protein
MRGGMREWTRGEASQLRGMGEDESREDESREDESREDESREDGIVYGEKRRNERKEEEREEALSTLGPGGPWKLVTTRSTRCRHVFLELLVRRIDLRKELFDEVPTYICHLDIRPAPLIPGDELCLASIGAASRHTTGRRMASSLRLPRTFAISLRQCIE